MPHHEYNNRNNRKYPHQYQHQHRVHSGQITAKVMIPPHHHHHHPHHHPGHHLIKGLIPQHSLCPLTIAQVSDESPFDNVLKSNDIRRATTLVSIQDFLITYPPRMTLDDFIVGKTGDEGFSETLCLFIHSGVYSVTTNFITHMLIHFKSENILTVLKSMKYEFNGESKTVMHTALRRATRPTVPSDVSIAIIEKLLSLGFGLNSLDDFNQSAIFYFIQGEDESWNYPPVHSSNDLSSHDEQDQGSHYRGPKYFCESNYKFNPDVWKYLMTKNVKLNLIDKFGDTPLSLAVKLHRKEIVLKLVISQHVDVSLPKNNPPFHTYLEECVLSQDIFRAFYSRVFVEKAYLLTNYELKTPLHCLLNNAIGQEDVFALVPYIRQFEGLKDNETLLDKQDALGHTPLMTAICLGYPFEILRLLIPRDSFIFSLQSRSKLGLNALSLALMRYQGGPSNCNSREKGSYFNSSSASNYSRSEGNLTASNVTKATETKITVATDGTSVTTPTKRRSNRLESKTEPMGAEASLHATIDALAPYLTLDNVVPKVYKFPCANDSGYKELNEGQKVNGGNENVPAEEEVSRKPRAVKFPDQQHESVLSVIMENKRVTCQTIRLLFEHGSVRINYIDILACMAHWRLEILDEVLAYVLHLKGGPFEKSRKVLRKDPKLKKMEEESNMILLSRLRESHAIPIRIVDSLFIHRHLYLSLLNLPSHRLRSSGNSYFLNSAINNCTSGNINGCNGNSSSASMSQCESTITAVAQNLAFENLKRVVPLLDKFFNCLGTNINFVDNQITAHHESENGYLVSEPKNKVTLLHAMIQASSWLPIQDIVDFVLINNGSKLNVELTVDSRGTPLNYAVHLGQFYIAEKLLDLNADVTKVDFDIPVLPLKKGFSDTIRRMVKLGARFSPNFAKQSMPHHGDPVIEHELNNLMKELLLSC